MLWAFDIGHAVDESGEKVQVDDMDMTQGFNSRPMPFKARFAVRDEGRQKVRPAGQLHEPSDKLTVVNCGWLSWPTGN